MARREIIGECDCGRKIEAVIDEGEVIEIKSVLPSKEKALENVKKIY